jgi:hypothetical protein
VALRDIELAVHRNGTVHFINSDPTAIALIPNTEVMEYGVRTFADSTPRPTTNYKLIWSGANGIVSTIDGQTKRFDFVIVGTHDSVIAVGDHWKVGDVDYRIEYVFPTNGYEVKGGGVAHGQPN